MNRVGAEDFVRGEVITDHNFNSQWQGAVHTFVFVQPEKFKLLCQTKVMAVTFLTLSNHGNKINQFMEYARTLFDHFKCIWHRPC